MDGFNIAQTIPLSSVIFRQTKKHLAMTSAAIKCGLIKVVTVLRLSCVLQLKSVEKNIVTVTSFFVFFHVYLPLFGVVVLSGNVFTCFRNYLCHAE